MASMVSKALEKFLTLGQEDYTSLMVTAISMSELHPKFSEKDLERLLWLEKYTHDNLMTSIYKLDRLIDPSTVGNKSTTFEYALEFKSDFLKDKEDKTTKRNIKIFSNDLQNILCIAIREVTQIIMRNFKDYNDEVAYPKQEEEGKSEW